MIALEIKNILTQIDTQSLLFFNSMHSAYMDSVMWNITQKWTWIPLYMAILYVVLKKNNVYVAIISIIAFVLTILYSDQICASVLRPYFQRPRPSSLDSGISSMLHIINGYRGGHYGMPSCHSANSFGLAFFMMYYFKNRLLNLFMFSWAIINSYSRLYVGVHYPSDLICGMIIGLSGALCVYYLLKFLLKKDFFHDNIKNKFKSRWDNKHILPIIYLGLANELGVIIYALL